MQWGSVPEAALLSLPMLPVCFCFILMKEPAAEAGAQSTSLKSDIKRKHCAQKTAHTHIRIHIHIHTSIPARLCYLESICSLALVLFSWYFLVSEA